MARRRSMAVNIEIKARVRDPEKLRRLAEALSDVPVTMIPQEDTFFRTPRGRLKLRVLSPKRGELIYYEREGSSSPKRSDYLVCATTDPETVGSVLTASLGIRGVVRKQRSLYKVDNARIHLDEVEGLGSFVEIEVVLSPGQNEQEGRTTAAALMAQLGVAEVDLVPVAYIDLLVYQ